MLFSVLNKEVISLVGVVLLLLMVLILDVVSTAYNILAIAGIVTVLSYKWNHIFKPAVVWYFVAFVLGILSIVYYQSPLVTYIIRGYLGYGIFLVVMMVGVLPNKWTFTRNIKKVRGQLSILGFLFITPHAFLHVFAYLDGVNLFGIAAYVLMIPLTLVSFTIIKKEIRPKDWNAIQQGAYLIYGLLFIHLLMVGDWPDKIVYAVLLTLYLNNKLIKEWKR
jgi:DMSO/TMAO reductase YedYZ heme-binding membrane subunit